MNSMSVKISAALIPALLLSGCAAVVAGTAGALIADEGIAENDGRFDPLEDSLLDGIYD
jgi:hypothetical protein